MWNALSAVFRCLLFLSVSIAAGAQTSAGAWAGEWGAFRPDSSGSDAWPHYEGRSLAVSDCVADRCKVSLLVQNSSGHGGASGELDIASAQNATVLLHAKGVHSCTLALTLTEDSVVVSPGSGDCSDFLTTGASFPGTYPLRTRAVFYDWNVPPCFADPGPGRLALCTSAPLAVLRKQWTSAFWEDQTLHPDLGKADDALERLVAGCDTAADPGTCLDGKFRIAIASYRADEAAWHKKAQTPGSPMQARQAAQSIAGDYRHTFPNGDVQGNQFDSTNTLHLEPEEDGSLRYSIHLEFFNGHECNRGGLGRFNIEGKFVDTQDAGSGHRCVFEIVPGADGVQLEDPTGWCKMTDCGMRGGYGGTKFSLSDRVSAQQGDEKK